MAARVWKIMVAGAALALAAALAPAGAAHADGPVQNLDVVLLVDQSGSMGGSRQAPSPSDTLGMRFDIQKQFIERLGAARLTIGRRARYRLAVVNFGSRVETPLGFTTITPDNEIEWKTLRDRLWSSVSEESFRKRNPSGHLGDTNFVRTFEEAERLLHSVPHDGTAQHAIVLVTDGAPEVANQTAAAHMEQLLALTQQAFPPESHKIYVIALDQRNAYWPTMQPLWEPVAPDHNQRTDSAAALGAYLHKVIDELVCPKESRQECGDMTSPGPVAVRPYLEAIQFDLFRAGSNDQIQIVPDGADRPLEPNEDPGKGPVVRKIVYGPASETWTILNPPPGVWQLKVSQDKETPKIYRRPIEISCTTKAPRGKLYQGEGQTLEIRCADSKGRLIEEYGDPQYRLDLSESALILSAQSIPLQFTGAGGAYTATFSPSALGRYATRLVVKTKCHVEKAPRRFELGECRLFEAEQRDLFEVLPPRLNIHASVAAQPLQSGRSSIYNGSFPPQVQPLAITVDLTDGTGAPLDARNAAPGGMAERLVLLRAEGERTGSGGEVTLAAANGAPHRLVGYLPLKEPDTYTLTVAENPQGKQPGVVFHPPGEPLKITRFADLRARVLDYEVRYGPGAAVGLLALLALLGLGLGPVRRWWTGRTPPLLQGSIEIVSGGLQRLPLQTLPLPASSNQRRFTRLESTTMLGEVEVRASGASRDHDRVIEVKAWEPRRPQRWLGPVALAGAALGAAAAALGLLGPIPLAPVALVIHIVGLLLLLTIVLWLWAVLVGVVPSRGAPVAQRPLMRRNEELTVARAGVILRYRN